MSKKKPIQLQNSYVVWRPSTMEKALVYLLGMKPLNFKALVIEWWLHNIAYYLTLPFIFVPFMKKLNERAKHVDLEVEIR
jgi:hypothetical protein